MEEAEGLGNWVPRMPATYANDEAVNKFQLQHSSKISSNLVGGMKKE